ncbi:hypothetical protein CASFOL_012757 [Castilleja foliolosa]|uniref:Dienelactone hydrolase domain-containing protein n=1 Tax=Castilleja foliolosa TaxID=1961234 RepID=A0ABD3DLC1_9LAMI
MDKNNSTMADHWLKLLFRLLIAVNTQVNGEGKELKIGGFNAYVTGPNNSNKAVILASDVFGYNVTHLRLIADKVGKVGYYTLVPDFFNGDPFVANMNMTDWIKNHPAEKGIEDAKPLIEALKKKGIIKIGAAGFCWGAKLTVDLTTKKSPRVQAAVLLHPTFITNQDIAGVKVPISFLGGQNDTGGTTASPTALQHYVEILKAKRPKVPTNKIIYPGAQHGWTTKYNDTDTPAVERAAKAHQDMLNWDKNI